MRFVLILLCASCAHVALPSQGLIPSDEMRAAKLIWQDGLHMSPSEYPRITWRGAGDCANGHGWTDAILGECVAGEYWQSSNSATIVARPKLSDSAYVHELVHAWQWTEYRISDPLHKTPAWGTVLPEMQKRLTDAGL